MVKFLGRVAVLRAVLRAALQERERDGCWLDVTVDWGSSRIRRKRGAGKHARLVGLREALAVAGATARATLARAEATCKAASNLPYLPTQAPSTKHQPKVARIGSPCQSMPRSRSGPTRPGPSISWRGVPGTVRTPNRASSAPASLSPVLITSSLSSSLLSQRLSARARLRASSRGVACH